jgi:hypothetical protein
LAGAIQVLTPVFCRRHTGFTPATTCRFSSDVSGHLWIPSASLPCQAE